MARRSRRLQARAEGPGSDEGKVEDRRLSAASVLGLEAPATTTDLEDAKAMATAEAAAATLDSYKNVHHVVGEDATDEKE